MASSKTMAANAATCDSPHPQVQNFRDLPCGLVVYMAVGHGCFGLLSSVILISLSALTVCVCVCEVPTDQNVHLLPCKMRRSPANWPAHSVPNQEVGSREGVRLIATPIFLLTNTTASLSPLLWVYPYSSCSFCHAKIRTLGW